MAIKKYLSGRYIVPKLIVALCHREQRSFLDHEAWTENDLALGLNLIFTALGKMRLSECRTELVRFLPSGSKFGLPISLMKIVMTAHIIPRLHRRLAETKQKQGEERCQPFPLLTLKSKTALRFLQKSSRYLRFLENFKQSIARIENFDEICT